MSGCKFVGALWHCGAYAGEKPLCLWSGLKVYGMVPISSGAVTMAYNDSLAEQFYQDMNDLADQHFWYVSSAELW